MKALKHKNCWLNQTEIKRLQRLLKTKTETEAIQKAIDLVLFQEEAAKAWVEYVGMGGVEGRRSLP